MLISNSKGFIYIHLNKSGGTSIECALSGILRWDDLVLGSTEFGEALQPVYKRFLGLAKHSSAAEVRRFVGEETWHRYFKFSTVRNPYALAVSQYTYSMQHLKMAYATHGQLGLFARRLFRHTRRALKRQWPFTYPGVQALIATGGLNSRFSDFIRCNRLNDWPGFVNQRSQLCDSAGNLIVDSVIKLEELDEKWPTLCGQLGIGELPLARVNASREPDAPSYLDYYSDFRDRDWIRSRYQADFEFFGYPDAF